MINFLRIMMQNKDIICLDEATSNEHCHSNLETLDEIAEKSTN